MPESPEKARRQCERYPLQLAVDFRWSDGHGRKHLGQGITRNISAKGVCITAPVCPPVTTRIHMLIDLPAAEPSKKRKIVGRGEVCRTTVEPGTAEFAVRCDNDLRFGSFPLTKTVG
jgi:hypothetical protein